MLASMDPEDVDALMRGKLHDDEFARGWTVESLHRELGRIRRQRGLSIDRTGALCKNVSSAAMAVQGPDGPVAAISVCPQSRSVPLERVAPLVAETVRLTAVELFG